MPRRSELSIALAIVMAGFGLGWALVATFGDAGDAADAAVVSSVERGSPPPNVPAPIPLFAMIAGRNLTVLAFLLSGLFTFGLMAAAVLAYNGLAIGGLVQSSLAMGMEPNVLARLILPHGVVELAAFVLAGAIGLRGWSIGCEAMRSERWNLTGIGRTAATSVGAVIVAAAIEATVTRQILLATVSSP